jgi:hypothetical protein
MSFTVVLVLIRKLFYPGLKGARKFWQWLYIAFWEACRPVSLKFMTFSCSSKCLWMEHFFYLRFFLAPSLFYWTVTSSSGGVLLVLHSVYFFTSYTNNSNTFFLLTSWKTKVVCRDFWCVFMCNLMARAGSLPCPCWPLGRPCVSVKEVIYLALKYSSNWPVWSSTIYFCTCSACPIKKKLFKYKKCDVWLHWWVRSHKIWCHQIGMYQKRFIFLCYLHCTTMD